ncbi:unnamed protein product [Protopolystoma xenopodis]|uniref:Uncharacterized protein n=1 Tax=Protopolystoma xenopodis TaxID=117903 RepID=A0A448WLA3_9PLAT|nr:unnamed protein product [Protopolystoma xenopodis]
MTDCDSSPVFFLCLTLPTTRFIPFATPVPPSPDWLVRVPGPAEVGSDCRVVAQLNSFPSLPPLFCRTGELGGALDCLAIFFSEFYTSAKGRLPFCKRANEQSGQKQDLWQPCKVAG